MTPSSSHIGLNKEAAEQLTRAIGGLIFSAGDFVTLYRPQLKPSSFFLPKRAMGTSELSPSLTPPYSYFSPPRPPF